MSPLPEGICRNLLGLFWGISPISLIYWGAMGGDMGLERLFRNQSRVGERVPSSPGHAVP